MKLSNKQARELGILPKEKPAKKGIHSLKREAGTKLFPALCKAHGLPEPVEEYPFAEEIERKWKFDWLFEGWLALEVEGGVFVGGRHIRGDGFRGDIEKYNEAAILGYIVLRCLPEDIQSGKACELVKRMLENRHVVP